MKNLLNTHLFGLLITIVATGCGSAAVTRISSGQTTDLSGRWNDTDAQLVAQEMTQDIVKHPWRLYFMQNQNQLPVIIIGDISNKSHEHINPDSFIKDIERELINTGSVRIVTHSHFREKIREEREDQQAFAASENKKRLGAELGADFMLSGTINSIVDTKNEDKVVFYQVTLELAHLETGEVKWLGDKKIKKYLGKTKKVKKRYKNKIPTA